jgi:hypothetical protein
MSGFWMILTVLLFFSAACWYGLVRSLKNGKAEMKGRCIYRSNDPIGFWIVIAFGFFVAMVFTGCVVFVLCGGFDTHQK